MRTNFIAILILSAFSIPVLAQNEADALKFSQNFSGGTARSLGLSGAFGALGGDASSLSINPAGIGVYRASEFTMTMGVNNTNIESDYLGTKYDDSKTKFNLSNLAYIYTYNTNKNTGWVSASFGIAYNRLNDFNYNATFIGENAQSSLLDEFTYYANSEIDNTLPFDQQRAILEDATINDGARYFNEALAFKAGQLIFLDEAENRFSHDYNFFGYNTYQKNRLISKGGLGEYDFSFGANFGHIIYLGATIGMQNLSMERTIDHYEQAPVAVQGLDDFRFKDHFNAYGNGWNFKAGAILKPIEFLRVGVAYHSPTYFRLESEYYTSVEVNYDSDAVDDYAYESTDLLVSEYKFKTPSKLIGSLAVTFDKYGLISFDVERTDYTTGQFRSDDYDYVYENNEIENIYRDGGVYNFKMGAEAKIGPFALRGGYAMYGKPFDEDQVNRNYFVDSYSGGIGIRGKSVFFDVAYVLSNSNEYHRLYSFEVQNSDNSYSFIDQNARMRTSNSKIMATLGFRF